MLRALLTPGRARVSVPQAGVTFAGWGSIRSNDTQADGVPAWLSVTALIVGMATGVGGLVVAIATA